MFRSPITPKDVLLNFKYALEHDLLLQRNFYSKENLQWFWGTYEAVANSNNTAVEQEFSFKTVDSASYQSCIQSGIWVWSRPQSEPGVIMGNFGAQLKYTDQHVDARRTSLCLQFNADTMQEVFGSPSRVSSLFPADGLPPPHGGFGIVFGEKSHPLGHSDVTYDLSDAKTRRKVSFVVIGNGLIRTIGVTTTQQSGK